jgi:diguanylate cyclase (GGDEF)-like protein
MVPHDPPPATGSIRQLPLRAQLYLTAMLATAIGTALWSVQEPPRNREQVTVTLVLVTCASFAQLFEVRTSNNKAYVVTLSFIGASALLLPPFGVVAVATAPFLVEMLVKSKRWYVQGFNIASHEIAALLASIVARSVLIGSDQMPYHVTPTARWLLAALASVTVLLLVNHATLVLALAWARNIRPRDTGLFGWEGVVTDSCLLALGVVIAELWQAGPAFLLFALVPFVLLQRALYFPALQKASRTDSKTGLFNAAYFRESAEAELRRATRTGTPMTVVVADLDLLRNINNAYGHLAGDLVLARVADVLRGEIREYDIAARFGGEEFTLLLPSTTPEEAEAIADRIRRRVGESLIEVATSPTPISVTVSLGIAAYPRHGDTLTDLLHRADLAVYRAKVEGRDRVRVTDASESPGTAPRGPAAGHEQFTPAAVLNLNLGDAPDPQPAAPEVVEMPPGPLTCLLTPRHDSAWDEAPATSPRPATGGRATWPVTAAVALMAALAVGISVWHGWGWRESLLVFPVLAVFAELVGDDVYGSSAVSLSAVAILAAISAGDLRAALVAAVVAPVIGGIAVRRRLEQVVFNTGNLLLCTVVAGLVRDAVTLPAQMGPRDLPLLLAVMAPATIAYFLVDNGLVASVVSLDEKRNPLRVFHDDLAWLAPHFLVFGMLATLLGITWQSFGLAGLAVMLFPLLLVRFAQQQYLSRTRRQVRDLRQLATDLVAEKERAEEANAALETTLLTVSERHRATAATLAKAIDARDETTGGHVERVADLGLALCRSVDSVLASDPQVGFGFLLHDVGKIAVPDSVLLKPGPLTPEERRIMQDHPELGATLLRESGFTSVVRDIALCHHERWDGNGYPRGLAGTEIPFAARLFSVCDALDAMTNDRPYARAIPLEAALDEIRRGSGTQFDPMAVEALEGLDLDLLARLLRLTGVTASV